ncbi:syntaxin [Trichosporon asahii var. asahii CBS 2479]|uniref:Syntaxin n=1 Tax=Trichosporon asahii var. asahii (strain ATCC 90039 / CBS 2479 / JCM 2466 / KCTC 7840 / NBRC 103889/ NCYC 2677 / UAMH 7654) TaxID=1186058 RepID=J6EX24_TRIAS|nr:syntaxin [Trichosporon asahii var. asahii CBS 2479]EJT47382.1 syntaxin [Trichosporon asahii var. asahii CBS 2479]
MARNRLQQPSYETNPSVPSQGGNPYAQAATGYPPPQQQVGGYGAGGAYGQQDQYAMGGLNSPNPYSDGLNGGGAGGDFWSQLSATNAELDALQEKIRSVSQAHQQTLNSTDSNSIAYADQLAEEARQARNSCQASVKQLYKVAKGKNEKTQAATAKTRLQNLLQEHQQIEKEYRVKTQERAARQFKIVKPDATPEEIKEVTESDNPQVFSQALLNTNRYGAARTAYREVQERHAEIQKIERTMTELAQMFNELSMLVEQQDEAITEIDNQMAAVHTDMETGNRELDGAIKKAKAARRKKWICFWICIIIIIIIVVGVAVPLAVKNNK